MGTIDNNLMSLDDDINNANIVKNTVLNALLDNNAITEEIFNEYSKNWKILIYKKSWFYKIKSGDKNHWYYKFFKLEDDEKRNITLS